MKRFVILLSVALLSVGCTANPDVGSSPATNVPVAQLDPQTCYIAGERFVGDATISLECGEEANAQIRFQNGEAVSTTGQLKGWTPISASQGTADDPSFIRVQIQKADQLCTYGRKLTEEPKETWKTCSDVPKPSGGKLVAPTEKIDS